MSGRKDAPRRRLTRLRTALVILASAGLVIGLAPAASAATYDAVPVGPSWVPNRGVHAVVATSSTVYVGGTFTGGVAALDAATGALKWLGNANGDVRALALTGDGRLLLGGAFTSVGGATHRKMAAVDAASGAVDNSFKPSIGGTVRDIVVAGSTAYFGGQFTRHDGIVQGGLGAVDLGTGDPVRAFTASANGNVYALGTDGARLFIGGKFTAVNGQTRNQLASVTLATNTLDAWAPATGCGDCNVVWDLTLDNSRNRVYTVGRNGGTGYTVDKTTGAFLFNVTGGVNGDSQAVTLAPDGTLYIGGHFTSISGQPIMLVAAFDVSGTRAVIDPTFSARFVKSYPGVWAMASTGSRLFVGGDFTAAGPKVNGQNVHPYFAMFPATGGGTGDITPPTVMSTSPAADAQDVSTSTKVTATFSEPVTGVDNTTFTLSDGTNQVPADVSLNGTTNTATLTPQGALADSTTYTATLASTGIADAATNAFAGLTWNFTTTTGGSGDTTAPTVKNKTPDPGQTGVGRWTNVTATFSELVQGVDNDTFTLVDPAGHSVTATVTQNSNNPLRWVLNPASGLQSGTIYTVTVAGGITDVAGNPIGADVTWSFTTG